MPSFTFDESGFNRPTKSFATITTSYIDHGRAQVEGVINIPGLAVCRVQMKTDSDRIQREGPGKAALINYVRAALCEDVTVELPMN